MSIFDWFRSKPAVLCTECGESMDPADSVCLWGRGRGYR